MPPKPEGGPACPTCGHRLEMTVPVCAYIDGDELVAQDVHMDDAYWTCASGHPLPKGLVDGLHRRLDHLGKTTRHPVRIGLDVVLGRMKDSQEQPA